MKLLVLGGTVFQSRAVAVEAVSRGHEVTCACRGESGTIPDGARHVPLDRSTEDPVVLDDGFDAVIDVARNPSWVRNAVSAFPSAHWVFVSTISVYPDHTTPGGTPATMTVHEALYDDADLSDPVNYGRMKVACEEIVATGTRSSFIARPGLIVGPGDPTGRFTYWPARFARADDGPVLAPGDPHDVMQVLDARDLAAWFVDAAEHRLTGLFDAVGPVLSMSELLGDTAAGVGADPELVWVEHDLLQQQEVSPWAGARSIPLWLPRPDYDGMVSHDPTPAAATGLTTRTIAETARDTLSWMRDDPSATVTGLTSAEEANVLAMARG